MENTLNIVFLFNWRPHVEILYTVCQRPRLTCKETKKYFTLDKVLYYNKYRRKKKEIYLIFPKIQFNHNKKYEKKTKLAVNEWIIFKKRIGPRKLILQEMKQKFNVHTIKC